MKSISSFEEKIICEVTKKTKQANMDNITRTMFYQNYYFRNKEIWWALLASMVSRNSGWNMTDLESNWYKRMLPKVFRKTLFLTYERANWLIFTDAYPQLLLYEISKRYNRSFFYLLPHFYVSSFMREEWERFFEHGEIERLCTALIINEQNLIQKPVIEHHFYAKEVFQRMLYKIQEHFHFCMVLFPTLEGKLFGISVKNFYEVRERIKLGKQLTNLLFKYPESLYIREFARVVDYTASRKDYERYMVWQVRRSTPLLRTTFPIVNHRRQDTSDWSNGVVGLEDYFHEVEMPIKVDVTDLYKHKLIELYIGMRIEELLLPKSRRLRLF